MLVLQEQLAMISTSLRSPSVKHAQLDLPVGEVRRGFMAK